MCSMVRVAINQRENGSVVGVMWVRDHRPVPVTIITKLG